MNKNKNNYLSKSILEGYRCINKVEITFQPGLNIIIGKNGSGKTNFLDFLNNSSNGNFDNYFDFNSTLYIKGEDELILNAKRHLSAEINESNENNIISRKEVEYSVQVNRTYVDLDKSSPDLVFTSNSEVRYQSNIIKHGIASNLPIIEIPFSWSIGLKSRTGIEFSLLTDSTSSYFLRSVLAGLFMNLRQPTKEEVWPNIESKKEQVKDTVNGFLNEIRSSLIKFSPINDIRISESLNVYFDEDKNEVIVSNLTFEYKIHNSWLPFSSLSDGTKRIFLIVSDLALTTNYNFKNNSFGISIPDYFSRIVFIEEPELGIHPHQLHLLMTFLREQSKNKQIIITTHSPQVLDVLDKKELDRIIICELDSTKGTQLRHLSVEEDGKAKSYMNDGQFLSDYWRFSDFNRV